MAPSLNFPVTGANTGKGSKQNSCGFFSYDAFEKIGEWWESLFPPFIYQFSNDRNHDAAAQNSASSFQAPSFFNVQSVARVEKKVGASILSQRDLVENFPAPINAGLRAAALYGMNGVFSWNIWLQLVLEFLQAIISLFQLYFEFKERNRIKSIEFQGWKHLIPFFVVAGVSIAAFFPMFLFSPYFVYALGVAALALIADMIWNKEWLAGQYLMRVFPKLLIVAGCVGILSYGSIAAVPVKIFWFFWGGIFIDLFRALTRVRKNKHRGLLATGSLFQAYMHASLPLLNILLATAVVSLSMNPLSIVGFSMLGIAFLFAIHNMVSKNVKGKKIKNIDSHSLKASAAGRMTRVTKLSEPNGTSHFAYTDTEGKLVVVQEQVTDNPVRRAG